MRDLSSLEHLPGFLVELHRFTWLGELQGCSIFMKLMAELDVPPELSTFDPFLTAWA